MDSRKDNYLNYEKIKGMIKERHNQGLQYNTVYYWTSGLTLALVLENIITNKENELLEDYVEELYKNEKKKQKDLYEMR